MFKKVKKVKNIEVIKAFQSKVFFCTKQGELTIGNKVFKNVEPYSFLIRKNYLLYNDFEGKTIITNLKTGTIKKINQGFSQSAIENNKIILADNVQYLDGKWKWSNMLYDLMTNEVFRKLPALENTTPKYLLENYIIGTNKGTIYQYSISKEKNIWEFNNFNEFGYYKMDRKEEDGIFKNSKKEYVPGKLFRYLGILNNILWMVLNSGIVLGLNATNGKLFYVFEKPDEYPDDLEMPESKYYYWTWTTVQLDKKNKKLIGGYAHLYFEMDISSLHYCLRQIPEEAPEIMGNHLPTFTDNLFFYAHSREGVIAILNRNNLKILWKYKFFTKDKGYIHNLIYNDKKLFVLNDVSESILIKEYVLEIFELVEEAHILS